MKRILTILLTLPGLVFGQTNYPPNSAPWTKYPTNWVYDCQFLGYGNTDPDASNYLACGWYDEPTNVIVLPTFTSQIAGTNLFLTGIEPVLNSSSFYTGGTLITVLSETVTLSYTNAVLGSNYVVLESYDMQTWNNIGSFTAGGNFGSVTLYSLNYNPSGFFRIFGAQAVPDAFTTADVQAGLLEVAEQPLYLDDFLTGLGLGATVVAGSFSLGLVRKIPEEAPTDL
jgi:hypothetical protein